MLNLLIGSSNVYRYYTKTDFPDSRQYKMVKCTQMKGFTAYMENLVADNVLVSVFENFVVDAVGADVVGPESVIDACVKDFLGVILSAAVKHPQTKFGIVLPLRRPALAWYQERIDSITEFMLDGVKAMVSDKNINNVASIACNIETTQQFESDLTHLTKTSARVFLETILESAETFFKAPLVDLTEPGEIPADQAQLQLLEDRLTMLENSMRIQADMNVGNDLMFARSREETDAISNKAKENRLVINGLKSATPMPSDSRQCIELLKTISAKVFEALVPNFQGKIVYLTHGKSQGQTVPMVEIKMENPEQAMIIRRAYAEKKKNKSLSNDLDSLFIANCVSLATRVRVDVMKAIARRLTNQNDLAYVAGFTSKPMMHIRKAGPPSPATKPLKSFSYIDSVTRFGHLVDIDALETAYGRAGTSFNGQLRQNFVILNERDQSKLQSVTRSAGTSGSRGPGGHARGGHGGPRGSGSGRGQPPRTQAQKRSGDLLDGSQQKK